MRRDPKCFLWDIQQATQRINAVDRRLADIRFEYNADWKMSMTRRAPIEIIIGEATNRTPAPRPATSQAKSLTTEKSYALYETSWRPRIRRRQKRPDLDNNQK